MTKSNELVVFGHNDLDMIGCMLNIEYKFPTVKKKYFFTNYSNIPQIVEQIKDYVSKNNIKHILIPDVSFSDNKDSLRELYNLANVIHIDHHMYPDGFWDEFPNMKVVWDKSKCAAMLCNEYFGNKGKNTNLDGLTYLIDVYDIWRVDNKHFSIAQDLNEYFWTHDIEFLLKKFIDNDYNLPSDFKEVTDGIKKKYTEAIDHYEKNGVIHRSGGISLFFGNEWFNQVNLREMDEFGSDIVIGINTYGITRIRINQKSSFTLEQLKKLRKILTGNEEYGHSHAFTYKLDNMNDPLESAKYIVNAVMTVKGI